MMVAALAVGRAVASTGAATPAGTGTRGAAVGGLALSYSRAAWVGLAIAVLYVGTFRYRRAWSSPPASDWYGVRPAGQRRAHALSGGLAAADPATALRLVEYRTASELIPVPWSASASAAGPNVELFLGVSSLYLLIAEEMGSWDWRSFWRWWARSSWPWLARLARLRAQPRTGTGAGLQADLAAALASGRLRPLFFPLSPLIGAVLVYAALFWLAAELPEDAPGTSQRLAAVSVALAPPAARPRRCCSSAVRDSSMPPADRRGASASRQQLLPVVEDLRDDIVLHSAILCVLARWGALPETDLIGGLAPSRQWLRPWPILQEMVDAGIREPCGTRRRARSSSSPSRGVPPAGSCSPDPII